MASESGEGENRAIDFPEVPANGEPVDGVATQDVVLDAASDSWVRLFFPVESQKKDSDPASAKTFPVIFFCHGGGFLLFSPATEYIDSLCRRLAKDAQVVVVAPSYRKAPQHRFPAPYEDCFKALEWLRDEHTKYLPPSADLAQCFLMGDSAGANIVHNIGIKASESAQGLKPISIVGHILIVPFFGGEERVDSELTVNPPILPLEMCDILWKNFVPEDANRDHPACRPFGPEAKDLTATALPPSLVIVAENDVLRDRGLAYADELKALGKSVQVELLPGASHAFHCEPDCQGVPFFELTTQFVRRVVSAAV